MDSPAVHTGAALAATGACHVLKDWNQKKGITMARQGAAMGRAHCWRFSPLGPYSCPTSTVPFKSIR